MASIQDVIWVLSLLSFVVSRPLTAQVGTPYCPLALQAVSSREVDFGFVTDVAVDSEGRIYVGDRFVPGVTVLRDDGSLSHRVGRSGDGPGEFRFVRNVSILPADSLAVFDITHGRLTVFAPGGAEVAYVRSFAQAEPRFAPPNGILLVPEQRRIIAQYFETYRAGQYPRADEQPRQLLRLLRWDGTLEIDTLLMLPGPQSLVARSGGAVAIGLHPFGFQSPVRLGPDGRLYFGRGDSLTIAIYDLSGTQVSSFQREYQAPRVTREDLEWGLSQVRSEILQRELRNTAPARWPAFRQLVVDDSGNLWIGLDTPRGQPQVWEITKASGEVLCRARLQDDVEVRLVRGDRVYAVIKDDLDVPRVAIFRWQGMR